ncbi:MAG: toxin, partial [Gammaproteobacteria bacterium]|nr:toxin [Gammaproteobacteria bacterium]
MERKRTEQNQKTPSSSDSEHSSSSASKSSPHSATTEQLNKAPAISLPKGGGAIQGMGEKFAANPVTGTGSMSVPIAVSPGRSGFAPALSLSYDSGSGNGIFGFGWSMSLPAISRKTEKGLPKYLDAQSPDQQDSDVFILSGSEDLVPVLQQGSVLLFEDHIQGYRVHRYRPRIEGLFARIERWTREADGDVHWRSLSKDNILTVYGKDSNSRIANPLNQKQIFTWLISETRDDKGNAVIYSYKEENGVGVNLARASETNRGAADDVQRQANRYIKRIRYGNVTPLLNATQRPRFLETAQIDNTKWLFEVVFDYGEHNATAPMPNDNGSWSYRNDPFSNYRAGFEIRTTRLCQRVLMFHHFEKEVGVGNNCLVRSTDFTYAHEKGALQPRDSIYSFLLAVEHSGYQRQTSGGYLKQSLPPVEFQYSEAVVQNTVQLVDPASLQNLPIGLDGSTYQWTDL